MKLTIFYLFAFVIWFHNLFAYPISPRPLRNLIIESENIVYGKVTAIKKNKASSTGWDESHIAVFKIYEVLQGKIRNTENVEIYFSPEFSCPMPAHYEKGQTVLAFLDKEKGKEIYNTHALSYGSKPLDDKEFSHYKNRILEMQNILKIKDDEEKRDKTVDWLISCASEKSTRWEGLYELSPESDFMSFYDNRENIFVRNFKLNDDQTKKLRNLFFKIDKLEYIDLGLVDLIANEDDPEVLAVLTNHFKKSDKDFFWSGDFFMKKIADLSKREDLKMIIKKKDGIDMMDDNYEKLSEDLMREFAEKL
ncbi:hypothetical protein CHRY9390_00316 [Chryseobacterium aquaeductus]|uniref:Uncharacterized protein n=1 Tax=Chryseobacterium aquaeductus TaxID=2675056 RepID=A0A9N8MDP5_9FLAO|nr:hypothetical protein [Chryseobacterium aquaeductus]CAA7329675.1 hypothetical protein CHRY9390_00316 [Chryseobacterium potabilaquae]CAD7798307.1 hypothetical protein CHRY9390_00316 [Chryseobacterium aquaeductus]